MVLHDINQALSLSDHLLALKDGRLYAQGHPRELVGQTFIREVFDIDLPFVEKDGRNFVITSLVNETDVISNQKET